MKYVVLASGLAIFIAVALAVKMHFVATGSRAKFLLLSAASVVDIVVFCREMTVHRQDGARQWAALVLFAVAATLFAWTIAASRSARLPLIFEPSQPRAVLRAGPYRYVRHPFYASYILFWGGCAIATLHPVNIAFEVAIIGVLAWSALQEEKGFEGLPIAADYREFQRSAGLFWPKLW